MRYLLWLIPAFLLVLPTQADFLGDLVNKLTGETSATTNIAAEISSTTNTSPTTVTAPTPQPQGNRLKHPTHIRILDKRTNRLTNHTLTTDAPWTFDDLTIQVKNCRRHHHQVGHHAAWFTIMDIPFAASTDNTNTATAPSISTTGGEVPPRFDGWMMSAFPSVAALEHPRYDLRLIECKR